MLESRRRTRGFSGVVAVLLLAALACSPLEGLNVDLGPSVEITSPASGATAEVGETVEIASTSTSDAGIERVELVVDQPQLEASLLPAAGLYVHRHGNHFGAGSQLAFDAGDSILLPCSHHLVA